MIIHKLFLIELLQNPDLYTSNKEEQMWVNKTGIDIDDFAQIVHDIFSLTNSTVKREGATYTNALKESTTDIIRNYRSKNI